MTTYVVMVIALYYYLSSIKQDYLPFNRLYRGVKGKVTAQHLN